MLAQEQLDMVSATTRPEERVEIVNAIAESSVVKGIYATKPMCVSLAEADAMIEACRQHEAILAIACHQNWNPWVSDLFRYSARNHLFQRSNLAESGERNTSSIFNNRQARFT